MRAAANFLFRTDQGRIDARTWRRAALALFCLLAVLVIIWRLVSPYAKHDLDTSPLFAPLVILAYLYLLFFSFAVILIAISFYNLSAKRWRDRGRPSALAGLVPLLALFAGAAHWLQPRVADVMSGWYVVAIDVTLAAIVVWTVVELGALPARAAEPLSSL